MKKRILVLLIALFSLTSLLCGCSFNGNGEIIVNEPVQKQTEKQITFYGFKADDLNLVAIESVLHGFMNENRDINVIYEGTKGTSYWTSLERRDKAGVLDDVFMIDQERVLKLGSEGKLADLRDVVDLELYNPKIRQQMTDRDGAVYFVPTCISTYNLYINYDILGAHGKTVPQNYIEFAELCDYFVSQGITPLIANNYLALPAVMTGKSLYDVYQQEDTASAIQAFNDNPETLAAQYEVGIDTVAEMIERKWIDPEEVSKTAQTSADLLLFEKNDRPFMITGGWASVRVRAATPDLNYGVYPLPLLETGSVLVIEANTCIAVKESSPYKKEAKDLIAYISQPDMLWQYCKSQDSYMPIIDDRMPDEKTIAPSNKYLTNGQNVIDSDYRLTVPIRSELVECSLRLLEGESADSVKRYLAAALGGGAQ